jgi:hypothetical protein
MEETMSEAGEFAIIFIAAAVALALAMWNYL